jgi:LCP family protein required for cell wall assembly
LLGYGSVALELILLAAVAGALILIGLLTGAKKRGRQRPSNSVNQSSEEVTDSGLADTPVLRTRHTRQVLVMVLLTLLVLTVGTGVSYVALLNHTITMNVEREALLPTPSESESAPVEDPSAGGALNMLLVGSDGKTSVANGRSDVIILMHISSDLKKVYLVHFPRDLYVDVPGHGKDKINAAFAYGGSQLLVRTLRNLVDVPLDHMAIIGFEGFRAMTDAVGGVDVYAEEASSDEVYNDTFTEKWYNAVHVGMNHLDGNSALAFVRERYQLSKGDISRGRRQQAFVKALMLKILSKETLTNPIRFAALVNAMARNLTVDNAFSVSDIYSQVLAMKDLRSEDIVFVTAPITGFGRSPQGASIDIVDEAKMAQLSIALRTDDMSGFVAGQ